MKPLDTLLEQALVRVTEKAAVAAAHTMGFGDGHTSDEVAAHIPAGVLDLVPPHRSDVPYVPGDVTDLDTVRHALRSYDAIIHLAAIDLQQAEHDPVAQFHLEDLGQATSELARLYGLRLSYA